MDVSSCLAVGALQVAMEQQGPAAMAQLLQDFERRSMEAEDLRSTCREELGLVHENVQVALEYLEAGHPHEAARTLVNLSAWTGDTDIVGGRGYMDEDGDAETTQDEDESDDDALACVICRSIGGNRVFYNMRAEGRWAGLAPGARIVCSQCHTDAMGQVESFF